MATKAELQKMVVEHVSRVAIFKSLVDNAIDAISTADLEGTVTYVNQALYDMFGYDYEKQEMIGASIATFWMEEDIPTLTEEMMPQIMAGGGWRGEVRCRRKDGSPFHTYHVVFPLTDEAGKHIATAAIIRDITERKRLEENLEQMVADRTDQVAIFKTLAGNSIDAIAMGDLEGKLTYVNRACYELCGYDYEKQEMIGLPIATFWPEEDIPLLTEEILPQAMAGGWRGEVRVKRKDGNLVDTYHTVFALRDETGNLVGVGTFIRDITERKRAEEELRRLGMAVEQAPDGIAMADLDGHIQFVNTAWAQMHGYSAEELQGKHLSIFHTEEQWQEDVIPFNERVMETGAHQGEVGHVRKDGTAFPTWMTITLSRDEEGNTIGLVGIARDITVQKEVEAERAHLQQEVIEAQKRAIQELSTPVIPVMEHIIIMPLIGSIDTLRAKDIMRTLLAGIREQRAKVVILDITGVPIVDSGVANHLNKTIQAARLKGTRTIVTGISDAVAETIVDLGIDWSGIETLTDLRTGLVVALNSLGIKLTR